MKILFIRASLTRSFEQIYLYYIIVRGLLREHSFRLKEGGESIMSLSGTTLTTRERNPEMDELTDLLTTSKGTEEADKLLSPLETLINDPYKNSGFAATTTGTNVKLVVMTLSPELRAQIDEMQHFKCSELYKKLGYYVQALQNKIPAKNLLCDTLISPIKIMSDIAGYDSPSDITDDLVEKSKVPISLFGSTATVDGKPIWECLPWEQAKFFNLFKLYRDSRYIMLNTGATLCQPRSIGALAKELGIKGFVFQTLSDIYHWSIRCAYYDMYMEESIQSRKETIQKMVVNDQLRLTQKLLQKVESQIDKNINVFKPAEQIKLLEVLLKFERISVELPPDKAAGQQGNVPTLSIYSNTDTGNITVNTGSAVENALKQDIKNPDNLLSILHVLQASGAMQTAILNNEDPEAFIDVDCLPTDEESVAQSPTSSTDIIRLQGEV